MKPITEYDSLHIGMSQRDLKNQCAIKKDNLIQTAISWNGCNQKGQFEYHWIWESPDGRYQVGVGKYGKEYYADTIKHKDGHRGNNPNDMNPSIKKDGVLLDFDSSFGHIFKFLEDMYAVSPQASELMGYLMVRNGYLCDHQIIDGEYKYVPPQDVIQDILEVMPEYDGISSEAYLHYIDTIAWNEDVKYHTLGYDVLKSGYGRLNNVLTYAHFIAVLLRRSSLYKICSNFARIPVGVSPLLRAEINDVYPVLDIR